MVEIDVDAEALEASLDAGFARLAAQGAHEARILLPQDLQPNHRVAEMLRARVGEISTLQRVVLVHPSPAVRFLASSLNLLVPSVQFDVVTAAPRRAGPAPPEPAAPFTASTIEARLGPPAELEREIAEAFERAIHSRATAIVLLMSPEYALERTLVGILTDHMNAMLGLRLLVLVHPSPAAGFLASTLALRCPRTRVVACATSQEVQAALRNRG